MLVKPHKDDVDGAVVSGLHRVWPVALGTTDSPADDSWCGSELVGIDVARRGSAQAVQSVLVGTRYNGVPVN